MPGTRPPQRQPCGCIEGHKRCPEHAAQYAVRVMTEKGWKPVPAAYEKDLKELGVKMMEWTIGFDEAKKSMKQGKWARQLAILLAANPAPWEVRKWFLQYVVAASRGAIAGRSKGADNCIEFVDTIKAADRLGGAQAVADVIVEHWENLGIEFLKALGGK